MSDRKMTGVKSIYANMPLRLLSPRRSRLPSWCIPSAYATTAVLLGLTLPRIEAWIFPNMTSSMTVTAAMAIYSAVATGMITLTGIVFSLVFVMVQFSSVAYSPRLVLWIARDPLIFHAIGTFTATFLYAVAALAWVDRSGSGTVPVLSVWLVIGLLLMSVAVFVGLVHRLTRLQIENVLRFTATFGRKVIETYYPPLEAPSPEPDSGEFRDLPLTQSLTYSGPPRAIQSLDLAALSTLAERSGGIIEMQSGVGDTLVESTPVLFLFGAREPISTSALWKAIKTGTERTFEQDPKYAIRLLVDIAIRALSPAVNDPTTAVQALDQIEDLLVRLGRSRLDIGEIRGAVSSLVLVCQVPTWEDFLSLAVDEIRAYGAQSVQVVRRLHALFSDLIDALPAERHPALRDHQKRLFITIQRSFPDADDYLEAAMEDREGLGAPRKRHPAAQTEPPPGQRSTGSRPALPYE
jgi:uncharacterized membrane protein